MGCTVSRRINLKKLIPSLSSPAGSEDCVNDRPLPPRTPSLGIMAHCKQKGIRRTRAAAWEETSTPMDFALSELPFFPLLFLPEDATISQLPFFSEDHVENSCLPARPPSACEECWEGPFAIRFGLPLVSPRSGKWYRRWPDSISYSTSIAKLESRANAGCVWCRFVLGEITDKRTSKFPFKRVIVTVRGTREERKRSDSGWFQSRQVLSLKIDGFDQHGYGKYCICAAPDGLAASYITTRKRIKDVGSPRALVRAREHIDECVDTHEWCKSAAVSSSPRLPTRLVDCADLSQPRLVTTIGQRGEYLTLSYVWGGDQVHKTTSTNLSMYEQGIAPSLLPPTIRDAIYVTHMLGFRWLWVDSLCIIQDSATDKAHEIGRMHHIYRYAHLTIIAATAKSVNESFLQERPFDGYTVALPYICPPYPTTAIGCPEDCSAAQSRVDTVFVAPLSDPDLPFRAKVFNHELGRTGTRAWCMQEYLMSPRALIFTRLTLTFRCLSATQGVGNSLYETADEAQIPHTLFLPLAAQAAPKHNSQEWEDMHTAWMRVVRDYTSRAVSMESDKLVACAALAEQFHRFLDSDYLAGLWRSDALLIHLLWKADGAVAQQFELLHTRPTTYRAPSWSWAAIDGPTEYHEPEFAALSLRDPHTVVFAEVAECWVTVQDLALPFGQVTDGALVLHGTPILRHGGHAERLRSPNLWSVPLPSFEQVRSQWRYGLAGLISDGEDDVYSTSPGDFSSRVTTDCAVDALPEKMWLVPLVRRTTWSYYEVNVQGIVLELASTSNSSGSQPEKTRFRRIGHFFAAIQRKDWKDPLWEPLLQAVRDGEPLWTDIVVV